MLLKIVCDRPLRLLCDVVSTRLSARVARVLVAVAVFVRLNINSLNRVCIYHLFRYLE